MGRLLSCRLGEGKVSLLREKLTVDEEFRLSLQDRVVDLALI